MIRGVKFASIPVTDQDRALAFYTDKLGFRLLTDQPFDEKQRWIELGISATDTRIVLFRSNHGIQPGTKMNVTFWADDVERTVRELEGKGVEFVMKPQKADWGTAAVFKDLDGNTFVITTGGDHATDPDSRFSSCRAECAHNSRGPKYGPASRLC